MGIRNRLALMLLVAVMTSGCGSDIRTSPPSGPVPVIILGLDTMRGDHLGAAGNDSISTPHLDALAADGVLFTGCRTTAPWTGPAFASIMTGLLPYHHGFLGGSYERLGDGFTTLAEHLSAAGYETGAFVTVKWLTGIFGMDQGFGELRQYYEGGTGLAAKEITARGFRFARARRRSPFFLFLHYFDPHAPYTPPEPFDRMYYRGDPYRPGEPLLAYLKSDKVRLLDPEQHAQIYEWLTGVTDWQYPPRQYAACVSYTDDHVGKVLADLKDLGIYERALIVAVADHGEHLGEHDYYYTHAKPYVETMHVPLIVKFPGGRHAGTVVAQGVSVLDILPTVLATLGLPVPEGLDGTDLTPLIGAPREPSRSLLLAEQGSREDDYTKSLVEDGWKLYLFRDGAETTRRLFRLADDPGELNDVAALHPDRLADLTGKLWAVCDGKSRLTDAAPLAAKVLTAEDSKQLRSLGYVR